MKKITWLFTVTISSFLGYWILNKISVRRDNKKWETSFYNKDVLIIGTGPSLDKVKKDFFQEFDVVIYLNHAVKIETGVVEEYFFTTDVGVLKDIEKLDYFSKVLRLGKEKTIVAPIFFQQTLFLSNFLKQKFTWVKAYNPNFKWFNRQIKFNSLILKIKVPSFWPKQPDNETLDLWYRSKNQAEMFPVIETTSALSAILFCAKYKPKKIRLIGCDFGMGRSSLLKSSNSANSRDAFNGAVDRFVVLKKYLDNKSISIENSSWDLNK
jgi:hypothetical protein